MKKLVKTFFLGGLWVLPAVLAGFIFGRIESIKSVDAEQRRQLKNERMGAYSKQWSFINPLLDCGEIDGLQVKHVEQMKKQVGDFVNEQKKQGISEMAVYFRDLNNGPWFGIEEQKEFLPASLLKVPLMLNVLKQSMRDPSFLNKQFIWQGQSLNREYFKVQQELEDNHTYSIEDALLYMIKYSDNNASFVLNHAIDTSTITVSYSELGILPPDQLNYSISAKTYSSFFRILYNSTFLSQEYSEKALKLLSITEFNEGIVAGIPSSSIKVAHKFGERQLNNNVKQLHDCGIVYYPDKPYLLCVMTRGKDFEQLTSSIAKISEIIYSVIDQNQ